MQEITGERREAEIKAKKEQTKLETDLQNQKNAEMLKRETELTQHIKSLKTANESLNDELIKCKMEKHGYYEGLNSYIQKNSVLNGQINKLERFI